MDYPTKIQWLGKDIETLSRLELIEVVKYFAKELAAVSADRWRWKQAADPIKYLMQGPNNDRDHL